jgi:Peptidase C39 family
MSAAKTVIGYQAQSDHAARRSCGAACLSMVYSSFGREISQAEIWPLIAKRNHIGSVASTTHLMTQDALNRGFSAVALQARHPLQALRLCRDFGLRAVLNHRLRRDAPAGHYSVLVDIDDRNVVLHDPLLGPSRRLTFAELLELWLPQFANSEIAGNVLIAIATPGTPHLTSCGFCHTVLPSSVECPMCKKPVGLEPGALLGCISETCIARMWNYICCPSCDYVWTLNLETPKAAASAGNAGLSGAGSPGPRVANSPTNLDVNQLFGEVDKFSAYVLSIPAVANHPEIKKQFDAIALGKEKFRMAYAEQIARRTMLDEQLAAVAEKQKEEEEANRQKWEDLSRPTPPLDGNALARSLLKNLGFID